MHCIGGLLPFQLSAAHVTDLFRVHMQHVRVIPLPSPSFPNCQKVM